MSAVNQAVSTDRLATPTQVLSLQPHTLADNATQDEDDGDDDEDADNQANDPEVKAGLGHGHSWNKDIKTQLQPMIET